MTFVPNKAGTDASNVPFDAKFPKQTPLGDRQASVTTVQTLAAILLGATPPLVLTQAMQYAVITVETVNIRWMADGSIPTTTLGNLVAAGGSFSFAGDMSKLRIVSVGAAATLDISMYDSGLGWAG